VQQERRRIGDPGVVEHDVEVAELIDGAPDHRLDFGLRGDVAADPEAATPQASDRRGSLSGRILVDVGAGDIGSRLGRHLAELPSEAAACAGDQRDLAFQAEQRG